MKAKLLLSERTYVCVACGQVIDRDENAAANLAEYGRRILSGSGSQSNGRGADPQTPCGVQVAGRVAPGISARGSHRSVRKPLDLHGSCHSVHQTLGTEGIHSQCANMRGKRSTIPRQHRKAFLFARSRLYFLRIQRTR